MPGGRGGTGPVGAGGVGRAGSRSGCAGPWCAGDTGGEGDTTTDDEQAIRELVHRRAVAVHTGDMADSEPAG